MADRARPSTTTKRLVLDTEDAAVSLVGRTLSGRYVLESILGQGGMGTVYAGRHQVIGRAYAVKVLRREIAGDHDTVLRFIQEAKIAGGLAHPNIVEVLDFGEVPAGGHDSFSAPFMVMPLLSGRTMADILEKEGPMDGARAARLFAQAADGLAAAHDKSIVHRDLKPDNLFVIGEGEAELVKVLDFGVAKLLKAPKLTKHGTVFGTPYYMSPEQASGRDVDPRTDQYALGVVMYELMSGRVPFDDDTPMGVMTKHLFATPEPLEVVVRDHQRLGRMGPIVMRCLEKRRESRFPDMRALAAALRGPESPGLEPNGSGQSLRSGRGPGRSPEYPGVNAAAPPSVTSRGTVRLPDTHTRGVVARTELDLPRPPPRPPGVSRAVVAVASLGAVGAVTGGLFTYLSLVGPDKSTPPSSDASSPSSIVASSASTAPPTALAPPAASLSSAALGPPVAPSSEPAVTASAAGAPSARGPTQAPRPPNTAVPTATSRIDPHVW